MGLHGLDIIVLVLVALTALYGARRGFVGEVLALSRSWHGVTQGAAAATYNSSRHGHGPAVPGSYVLPAPTPYRPALLDRAAAPLQ